METSIDPVQQFHSRMPPGPALSSPAAASPPPTPPSPGSPCRSVSDLQLRPRARPATPAAPAAPAASHREPYTPVQRSPSQDSIGIPDKMNSSFREWMMELPSADHDSPRLSGCSQRWLSGVGGVGHGNQRAMHDQNNHRTDGPSLPTNGGHGGGGRWVRKGPWMPRRDANNNKEGANKERQSDKDSVRNSENSVSKQRKMKMPDEVARTLQSQRKSAAGLSENAIESVKNSKLQPIAEGDSQDVANVAMDEATRKLENQRDSKSDLRSRSASQSEQGQLPGANNSLPPSRRGSQHDGPPPQPGEGEFDPNKRRQSNKPNAQPPEEALQKEEVVKQRKVNMERLARLAQPRNTCGEWCGNAYGEQQWKCQYPYSAEYCKDGKIDPDTVDWNRLAHYKVPCQHGNADLARNFVVSRAALQAVATRRLEKLAEPRKVVNSGEFYVWMLKKKPNVEAMLKPVKKLCIDKIGLGLERVFLRCDLDAKTPPDVSHKVDRVLETIRHCLDKGAKAVIVASHCGEPCGRDPALSLKPIAALLSDKLEREVTFLDDSIGPEAQALCEDPEPGSVFLLENLSFYDEDRGVHVDCDTGKQTPCTKEAITQFRAKLFALGDVFVHDSFNHLVTMTNTTIGSSRQERSYGFHVKKELEKYNSYVTRNKDSPVVAVIGGAFNDKISVAYNIMGKVQDVLLGGEIAQIFLKTLKGIDIGVTPSASAKEKKVLACMDRAKDIGTTVNLPSDFVIRNTKKPEEYFTVSTKSDIEPWFEIVDIGRVTRKCYLRILEKAASIIWSGDMGVLLDGTAEVADAFAQATERGARTFIAEEETYESFRNLSKDGKVTDVTMDGRVTSMLLHGKMPKGLAALSPYRKTVKKRARDQEVVSYKFSPIDQLGYAVESGFNKLCVDMLDVDGKRVLISCDMSCPVKSKKVTDNYNLRMVVPTIKWVLKRGARCVILVSPIVTQSDKKTYSLKPQAMEMEKLLGRKVHFIPTSTGTTVLKAVDDALAGSVLMLENVRMDAEEHYSFNMEYLGGGRRRSVDNVATYCAQMSMVCDIWVNDAFSLLGRDSSTTTGCMHRLRPCGFLVKNELKYLSKTFNSPPRKFLAIIGGPRVHKQMSVFRGLLRDADEVIVSGTLGLHFLSVLQGMKLGLNFDRSLQRQDVEELLALAQKHKVRLYLPVDIVTTPNEFLAKDSVKVSVSEGIAQDHFFADIGSKTISLFSRVIKRSKLCLWVGCVGICTCPEFTLGTRAVYDAMVAATQDPRLAQTSIVGGTFLSRYVHSIDPNHEGLSHVTTGMHVLLSLLSEKNAVALNYVSHNVRARTVNLNRMHLDQADIKDKRVLLRVDFTALPRGAREEELLEPIKAVAASIKAVQKRAPKNIVLISHLGDPRGCRLDQFGLNQHRLLLEKVLKTEITWLDGQVSEQMEATLMRPDQGKIYMLENIRFNPEEQGYFLDHSDHRQNVAYEEMEHYRMRLSKFGDVFVNESMESLHCHDASVVGIKTPHRVTGPTLKAELITMNQLLPKIEKPIIAVIGGTESTSDRIRQLYDILDLAQTVVVAGRTAFTMLKVIHNMSIGKHEFDKQAAKIVPRVVAKAKLLGVELILPTDFKLLVPGDPDDEESEDTTETVTIQDGLLDHQRSIDIGEASLDAFVTAIKASKTVLYCGTPGTCTQEISAEGAKGIFEAIGEVQEEGGVTIAFAASSLSCISELESGNVFSLVSRGQRMVIDLILGNPLPGLDCLMSPPSKGLPVMDVEQANLKGRKVLLRLDLDVPTVEGVVLDIDKIEDSLETIRYILSQKPACLILAGFRGNPKGYKNHYLSMRPLAMEYEHFLESKVLFMDEPCSRKARLACESAENGQIILLENLKFYPAELMVEEEMVDILQEDDGEEGGGASKDAGDVNIDRLMYELMPYKSLDQYTRELGDLADVFVNDDVTHMNNVLLSNRGFDLGERVCGLRLRETLRGAADVAEMMKAPALSSLSPAPKD